MERFGKFVVRFRRLILIVAIALLVPAAIGYVETRVNYDLLYYLPDGIDTMDGQDILMDDFGAGAFSMIVLKDMDYKSVSELKSKIENVEHVSKVIWYDSFVDLDIPVEMMPSELKDAFNTEDSTLMMVIFDDTSSGDGTMEAIGNIRKVADKQCFISGISAIVTDTKELSEKETPIYVVLAVVISIAVMCILMDSYLVPIFFLLSIGMAIVYNLGSNIVMGEISYVTKALAAVLQLGVTMDYSIFLWHSYEEQRGICDSKEAAMAKAISSTIVSVVGSSITTVAGFIALCFMSFTLGLDLGIVMAKGVLIGVIACVTVLPSLILIFDGIIEKTKHKPLLPEFRISKFVAKHYIIIAIVFVVLWIPAVFGYNRTSVYYNLDSTLPESLPSIQANNILNDKFAMNTMEIVLVDTNLSAKQKMQLANDMKNVDGVKTVLGLDALVGPAIPDELIPDDIKSELIQSGREMMLVMSEYKVASDEVNEQCNKLEEIIKSYDDSGMLIGEAPCTRDLIKITDKDFKTVSAVSIGVIFLIIAVVFKSISLPVILVITIEFAIFVNMGIPYYTGSVIPFIASIVIGTIQLGSTVDYAILMTTRYKVERNNGKDKKEAVTIAHQTSIRSIFVSAMSFFAATFGVGVYSDIDMISQLCTLMARGAIISMVTVLLVLPSMLIIFDKLICVTSIGIGKRSKKNKEEAL